MVSDATHSPPVCRIVVPFTLHNLRRLVLRRPASGVCLGIIAAKYLGQVEVDYLEVTFAVEHEIAHFDVPVHDIVSMQRANAEHKLRN